MSPGSRGLGRTLMVASRAAPRKSKGGSRWVRGAVVLIMHVCNYTGQGKGKERASPKSMGEGVPHSGAHHSLALWQSW